MKKLIAYLLSYILISFSFAQKIVNDPNVEARQLPAFHAIHVSNAFSIILTQGNETGVAVSANEKEYVQHIETKVENGTLYIRYENKGKWWKNMKLKAYISVTVLDNIKAGGASDINIDGDLNVASLYVDFSGASDLKGSIHVKGKLDINLNGASDITINGSASETTIEAHGASDVKAYDFQTGTCDVHASGASDVHITVDKEISARLSGASSVSYKGNATIKDIKTSGASNISRKS